MEVFSWAGPFCFKADMWSSFCLLHLSKKHPESVAMGAIHKVDSNVLRTRFCHLFPKLPVNTDLESKSSKRLH